MRSSPPATFLIIFALFSAILVATGCKEKEAAVEKQDNYFKSDPVRVAAAHQNRLGSEPTAFLRHQAESPIHWQPWDSALFEHAQSEQKIIFALVVNGNFPATHELLENLSEDPALVRLLHTNYICCLVDVHAHPEVALHSKFLASEINRPIGFPTMLWLTHEKSPVAWLPLNLRDVRTFEEIFLRSHEMLSNRWSEQPRYVMRNSGADDEARVGRVTKSIPRAEKVDLSQDVSKAARELSALYDPTSGEMDGSGGLVPFSLLQFSSIVANAPGTTPTLRKRLVQMLQGHTDVLLKSAVHDPLDRGFFSARRTRGWSLPVFAKDSMTQLEGVIALTLVASATEDKKYLDHARRILAATEAQFSDAQGGLGLYQYAASEEQSKAAYLWSLDKLKELLQPEEFSVIEKSFAVTALGNIPIESDPQRSYFRLNSLGAKFDASEIARELQQPAPEIAQLLESARKRLLVYRQEQLGEEGTRIEMTRPVGLMARYVSALAELGMEAGDATLLERARTQLDAIRKDFVVDGILMRIPPGDGRRGITARGIDYALLLDAIFMIYRLDLNTSDLIWAHDLAKAALVNLKDNDGLLQEAPSADRLLKPPTFSNAMLFGASTWGTIYGPLARLHLLTGSADFSEVLDETALRVAGTLPSAPLVHTDFGISALTQVANTLVCLDGPPDAALNELRAVLRDAAYRSVTVVRLDPALPAEFTTPQRSDQVRALVLRGGELVGEASTAEALRSLLGTSASEN